MKILILYWSIMLVFYLLSSRFRQYKDKFSWMGTAMMWFIYIVVFVMGVRMGINDEIILNLGTLGLESLALCLIIIIGTMFSIYVTRKLLGINRYGDVVKKLTPAEVEAIKKMEREKHEGKEAGKLSPESKHTLVMTVVTITLVGLGMIVGHFVVPQFTDDLKAFDEATSNGIVYGLCLMLVFVGSDLGFSGTVAGNIKKVGLKVFAFPFAMIVGGLIFGAIGGAIFGYDMKDSLAIAGAFGWYSYAPIMMSSAGAGHAVASAVCFMTNVIRETLGIIFIPLAAKTIGYMESLGIAGMADMDVCMPIIERSCREETVVYGFVTGFFMCITTSILVPALMG
ncbi:MAG: lysine exporter LysO family protein [Clostridia bacterium]|nr:lysine exporter LysO family protein [Clostridia bacterium]